MDNPGRRGFMKLSAASLATFLLPGLTHEAFAANQQECSVDPKVYTADPRIAVSLKRLAGSAMHCRTAAASNSTDFCGGFVPLGGMTRLDGFVVDPVSRDIVLWGQKDPEAPPLMLDDFVIALRAAHGQYAVMEGGRKVIYEPGISIDANPQMWVDLRKVDVNTEEGRARYEEICTTNPMRLRVDGMPRHTRVADILLAADYRMKLVNEGKATIPIKDFFKSLEFRAIEQARLAFRHHVSFNPHDHMVNRFWFRAGSFQYQATPDGSTTFLRTSQIMLSQASEIVRNGKMVGTGKVANFEQSYICDWNERMEETYAAEEIWRQMFNVFRHFALTKIMVETNSIARAGMDASILMHDFSPKRVQIPDTLPGAHLITFVKDPDFVDATCGGVSLGFPPEKLKRVVGESMGGIDRRVLGQRPAGNGAAVWQV